MPRTQVASKWKCDACDKEYESFSEYRPEGWDMVSLHCGTTFGKTPMFDVCAACLPQDNGSVWWKALPKVFKSLYAKAKKTPTGSEEGRR